MIPAACPSIPTARPARKAPPLKAGWPGRLWSKDQATSRLHHHRRVGRLPAKSAVNLGPAPNPFRCGADKDGPHGRPCRAGSGSAAAPSAKAEDASRMADYSYCPSGILPS